MSCNFNISNSRLFIFQGLHHKWMVFPDPTDIKNQWHSAGVPGRRCCCTDMDHAEGWDDAEQHLDEFVKRGLKFLGYKSSGSKMDVSTSGCFQNRGTPKWMDGS